MADHHALTDPSHVQNRGYLPDSVQGISYASLSARRGDAGPRSFDESDRSAKFDGQSLSQPVGPETSERCGKVPDGLSRLEEHPSSGPALREAIPDPPDTGGDDRAHLKQLCANGAEVMFRDFRDLGVGFPEEHPQGVSQHVALKSKRVGQEAMR